MASRGLAEASRSEQVANEALHELQARRRGLLLATVFIAGLLVTLWLKIRSLSPTEPTQP